MDLPRRWPASTLRRLSTGYIVKRTRIVLAGMSRMMLELTKTILASDPYFSVVGHVAAGANLRAAVRRYRADILIVMPPDGIGSESDAERLFWRRPCKILAIEEGGRKGKLYVLHPYASKLDELSVDSLIGTLRSEGKP